MNAQVKIEAFEELTYMCKNDELWDQALVDEHIDKWGIYLNESAPALLEKVITCLLAFLKNLT